MKNWKLSFKSTQRSHPTINLLQSKNYDIRMALNQFSKLNYHVEPLSSLAFWKGFLAKLWRELVSSVLQTQMEIDFNERSNFTSFALSCPLGCPNTNFDLISLFINNPTISIMWIGFKFDGKLMQIVWCYFWLTEITILSSELISSSLKSQKR